MEGSGVMEDVIRKPQRGRGEVLLYIPPVHLIYGSKTCLGILYLFKLCDGVFLPREVVLD